MTTQRSQEIKLLEAACRNGELNQQEYNHRANQLTRGSESLTDFPQPRWQHGIWTVTLGLKATISNLSEVPKELSARADEKIAASLRDIEVEGWRCEGPRHFAGVCGANRVKYRRAVGPDGVRKLVLYSADFQLCRAIWDAPVPSKVPPPPIPSPPPIPQTAQSVTIDLYPWQERALAAWHSARDQGVIQAVPGAGKTRLALVAVQECLRNKRKVAILVPSQALTRQWDKDIRGLLGAEFPGLSIGHLGDGSSDTLRKCDVLIARISAACQTKDYRFYWPRALLIADECHLYGAETWSHALDPGFPKRLGLTATYERTDSGLLEYLDPYFKGTCYSLDYKEALADEIIAHIKIALVGVEFSRLERPRYDEANDRVETTRDLLLRRHHIPTEPFGAFMKEVTRLAGAPCESLLAQACVKAFGERRKILARADAKFQRLRDIAPAITAADRSIIFTQTTLAATEAIHELQECGVRGKVLESSMKSTQRDQVFASFEIGNDDNITASTLLDHGIDVPACDMAIILSGSQSRRQMIQRMGRVLRKKDDGRLARVAIFFVKNTSEDPTRGVHETFIDLIDHVADDVQTFFPTNDAASVVDYLTAHGGSRPKLRAHLSPSYGPAEHD